MVWDILNSIIEGKFARFVNDSGYRYAYANNIAFYPTTTHITRPLLSDTVLHKFGRRGSICGLHIKQGDREYLACLGIYTEYIDDNYEQTMGATMLMTPLISRKFSWFSVEPETLTDRIRDKFHNDDIDFENEDFSRNFFVMGHPRRFAYNFFTPRMIEMLLPYEKLSLLYIRNSLIIYSKGFFPMTYMKKCMDKNSNPVIEWMINNKRYLDMIIELAPEHMFFEQARLLGEVEEEETRYEPPEEDQIATQIDSMGKVMLQCPRCEVQFEIREKAKEIKCPKCGLEGSL